jgi:hypothetical protein
VFYGPIRPSPDRAVGVRLYQGDDDLVTGLAVRRVQLRFRGAPGVPDDADALASATFRALQGLTRTAGISLVRRVLVAPLPDDANARAQRADSYQITLDNSEVSP